MTDHPTLDNPVWHALSTVHQPLARSNGLAVRYPGDVSPMAALREPSAQAFADLRALVAPGEKVALLTSGPLEIPNDWQVHLSRFIDQMACPVVPPVAKADFVRLTDADVPDMLALTAATEPGPFMQNTIRMGRYFGVRSDTGQLVAMAGQRLASDRFTEISAVCTDPAFRGQGHAHALIVFLAAQIHAEGKLPVLHVKTENSGAKALYERIGFRVQREIRFSVLMPV